MDKLKMHVEYCVQHWTGAKWCMFEHGTYDTEEAAKRALVNLNRLYQNEVLRVGVRLVGDWCELRGSSNE